MIKLVVFGLVQWFLLMIAIFVISLIYGIKESAEMTAPPSLGFAIAAVIMVGVAYAFARWLKPASRKQAIIAGLMWSVMTTVFWLVTVFANSTQDVIFKGWGVYLLFVAQVIGTMFVSVKKADVGNSLPTI
ncbi:MAG: hypothetical protein AAB619_02055 [Patescibacteria group bacterium]